MISLGVPEAILGRLTCTAPSVPIVDQHLVEKSKSLKQLTDKGASISIQANEERKSLCWPIAGVHKGCEHSSAIILRVDIYKRDENRKVPKYMQY